MEDGTKNVTLMIASAIIGGLAVYLFLPQSPALNDATPPKTIDEVASEHISVNASDIKWVDAPNSLPKGAKLAVIEGDPSKAVPFTLRIQLPPNYTIAPHIHPAIEHVTILSGALYFGKGETFDDASLKLLSVGSFVAMPSGMPHFAKTKGEGVTLQLHGVGPWGLTYINPADDPRSVEQ